MKTIPKAIDVNEILSIEPELIQEDENVYAQILATLMKKFIFIRRSWKSYTMHILLSLLVLIILHVYSDQFGKNVYTSKLLLNISARDFTEQSDRQGIVILAINSTVENYQKWLNISKDYALKDGVAEFHIITNMTLHDCKNINYLSLKINKYYF